MVDKIEMSLDDIIKANKSKPTGAKRGGIRGLQRKGGRGGGGGGVFRGGQRTGGSGILKGRSRGGITRSKFPRGDVNSAWKHDMYDGPKRNGGAGLKVGGAPGSGAKLVVSNLDYGVSESDIHELFADFGPLKSASVHYDRSGRSLGTADVIFERRADAVKAMKQYHGVPLDGRPMNIQLTTSELPASSLKKPRLLTNSPRSRGTPRRPTTGARGGGIRRTTTKSGTAPTAEELDAELDAYVNDMK
uniref:Putative rrm motif-containing protein n=1 Tax=Tabanus bromius TaxID=304241 RepID=A0A0K8TM95_TABBR